MHLENGDCAFYYALADAQTGPAVHVTVATDAEQASTTLGVVTVTRQDMTVLAKPYQNYVTASFGTPQTEVKQLRADI